VKIRFKSSEVLILLAASVMSLLANLPDNILGSMIDRKMILGGLIALVVVALFRYLQAYLLLLISILAIGANLPSDVATALGISQIAMLISLAALIAIALLNRFVRLFPTEHRSDSENFNSENDHRRLLLEVISRGDQVTLHRMLVMNPDVNFIQDGMTPLHFAAERGYPEIVRLLISYGADYRTKNAQGKTALEIALDKKKFVQTTEILYNANKPLPTFRGQAETRRSDAEIWQKQHH
jgi:ankyrin repeat protein